VAVQDPTNTYKWELPDVGGDIGAWGGLLNTIFSNELDAVELAAHIGTGTIIAPQNGISPPPGIDQIVNLLQIELDGSEADEVAYAARVTTLEGAPPTLLTSRVNQSAGQSIPGAQTTPITWDTIVHDQGGLTTPDISKITVPADGQGLWQLRASVKLPVYGFGSGSDDGVYIELSLVKNGLDLIGFSRQPLFENGVHSTNSLDITREVSATDVAAVGDTYEVRIKQGIESERSKGARLAADDGTFFEGIRVTREVP